MDPEAPPLSMKVLAERIFCNAPNLSFITNQLVDRGFVEGLVDPDGRRYRGLVPTGRVDGPEKRSLAPRWRRHRWGCSATTSCVSCWHC